MSISRLKILAKVSRVLDTSATLLWLIAPEVRPGTDLTLPCIILAHNCTYWSIISATAIASSSSLVSVWFNPPNRISSDFVHSDIETDWHIDAGEAPLTTKLRTSQLVSYTSELTQVGCFERSLLTVVVVQRRSQKPKPKGNIVRASKSGDQQAACK